MEFLPPIHNVFLLSARQALQQTIANDMTMCAQTIFGKGNSNERRQQYPFTFVPFLRIHLISAPNVQEQLAILQHGCKSTMDSR